MSSLISDAGFLASAAVVLTSVATAAIWGLRKAVKLAKRVGFFLDDFQGTPARPGVQATPGVMVRLQTFAEVQGQLVADRAAVREQLVTDRTEVRGQLIQAATTVAAQMRDFDQRLAVIQDQVQVIHHEMVPNEGQSLKDQMNRVDQALQPNGGDTMADQIHRVDQALMPDDGDSMKDQVTRIDENTKPAADA